MLAVAGVVNEIMEALLEAQVLGSFVGLAAPVEAAKARAILQIAA